MRMRFENWNKLMKSSRLFLFQEPSQVSLGFLGRPRVSSLPIKDILKTERFVKVPSSELGSSYVGLQQIINP